MNLSTLIIGFLTIFALGHMAAVWTGEFKLQISVRGKKKLITSPVQSFKLIIENIE